MRAMTKRLSVWICSTMLLVRDGQREYALAQMKRYRKTQEKEEK